MSDRAGYLAAYEKWVRGGRVGLAPASLPFGITSGDVVTEICAVDEKVRVESGQTSWQHYAPPKYDHVFFLVIEASDGEHIGRYVTERSGLAELARQLGRDARSLAAGVSYVDDNGRRVRLEKTPGTVTLRDRRRYSEAFAARECDTLTPALRGVLDRIEGARA